MPISIAREDGKIHVSEEVVALIAGKVALACDGIVDMSSRNRLRDGISELLGREAQSRGIEVTFQDDRWHVGVYVVVRYGGIISEIATACQSAIREALVHQTGIPIDQIDLYVHGVRIEHVAQAT
ncbi:MAG: Asp23/Gls24 family envelope stress response protein [Paenibacillaceae bacterium]|nr:Asp23/Gls24 family envelope stress response protein [Paenibacillaceae bacterium]